MKTTENPQGNPAAQAIAARFAVGETAIGCDRHADALVEFARSLEAGSECSDQVMLDIAESMACPECSLIAKAVLGTETVAGQDLAKKPDQRPPEPTVPLRKHPLAIRVGDARILAEPLYLPEGPYCPTPVRIAAAQSWNLIAYGQVKSLPFTSKAFPSPKMGARNFPLVVTTPFRVQLEYAKGNDWDVALPLAPQRTRIVIHTKSRLYDPQRHQGLKDSALAKRLGGAVIAVTDKSSTYATRLILAARKAGFREEFISKNALRSVKSRNDRGGTLFLLVASYESMISLIEQGEIDGFSTVEPFPALAKFQLGNRWAEATMSAVPGQTDFCCVVAVPAALRDHRGTYDDLLRSLIRSLCGLLRPKAGLDELMKHFESSLRQISGKLKIPFDPTVISAHAAISALKHFTEHLQDDVEDYPERSAAIMVPRVQPEELFSDQQALSPHLSRVEKRKFQTGLARLSEPSVSQLFNFDRAREIFTEVLRQEFREGVRFSEVKEFLDREDHNS